MKLLLSLVFAFTLAQPLVRASETAFAVLEEMNLARTNPQEYAQRLAAHAAGSHIADARAVNEAVSFLNRARPLPPLSFADGLALAAQMHVSEQGTRGGFGHGNPWSRIARYGQFSGRAGENISYGFSSARGIVAQLIIDAGVPGRGHRKNIFSSGFRVAGIACGSHARFGAMCVIDFAGGFEARGTALASSGASRFGGS
jgi:uncharacterized protein YkwD